MTHSAMLIRCNSTSFWIGKYSFENRFEIKLSCDKTIRIMFTFSCFVKILIHKAAITLEWTQCSFRHYRLCILCNSHWWNGITVIGTRLKYFIIWELFSWFFVFIFKINEESALQRRINCEYRLCFMRSMLIEVRLLLFCFCSSSSFFFFELKAKWYR